MEDRIRELLERYWDGDTSLEEEMELQHFLEHHGAPQRTKEFFSGIRQLRKAEPENVKDMKPRGTSVRWRRSLPG